MRLIIQGNELTSTQLQTIQQIATALSFREKKQAVYQFEEVDILSKEKVFSYCKTIYCDAAFLPESMSSNDFKLLAMDMDSTFIQIECIDEIAATCHLKAEVSQITEAAMRGEIDFNESLTRRVALLKGVSVTDLESVYVDKLRLNPGAEQMLQFLQSAGIKTLLVSGGFTFFTDKLKSKYHLDFTRANELEVVDGKLTGKVIGDIVNAAEKKETLKRCCESLKISPFQTIAMGDGANDLQMMSIAGLSIAYHAKPKVQDAADVAFNFVGLDGVENLM